MHSGARLFKRMSGLVGQAMCRAVYIAILMLIERQFTFDHCLWFVRGGGIIQIDPVRMRGKKRELSAKISSS